MTSIIKRFAAGFSIAMLTAAFLNKLPNIWTRGAYHGDGFEVIGFPLTFRRLGGVAGIYEFHITALLADIGLALVVALLVGYAYPRVHQRDST